MEPWSQVPVVGGGPGCHHHLTVKKLGAPGVHAVKSGLVFCFSPFFQKIKTANLTHMVYGYLFCISLVCSDGDRGLGTARHGTGLVSSVRGKGG